MEKWEKEILREADRRMSIDEKRIRLLTEYATKNKKGFLAHVAKVLSRIGRKAYRAYVREIRLIAEEDELWEKHRKKLTYDTNGFLFYLSMRMEYCDYPSIAKTAGIDPATIETLMRERAEEVYPPRKKTTPKAAIQEYRTIATDIHKAPNDRDTLKFFEQTDKHVKAGKMNVTENPKPKKGAKKTHSVISFGNQKGFAFYHVYNAFDKSILGAVYSLKKAGNDVTTIDILYAHINGKEGRVQPTPAMRKKMLDSLRAMGSTWVVIEFDTENQYHYENSKIRYEGNLLEIKIKEAYVNGNLVEDAIIINGFSPLVEVAEMKNQILEYPKKLLDVPVSCTEETIIMREELLRRIYNMKNHGQTKVIVLEEAFEQIDYKGKSPKDRGRILDKAYKMMDYWKEQGHIFGYKIIRKGQTPYSIEVKPYQPKKLKGGTC